MPEGVERGVHSHARNTDQLKELLDAIDDLWLWEPGRKGYAAALRRVRIARSAVSAEPYEREILDV